MVWHTWCTWWTAVGVTLFLICLVGAVRAGTSSRAWFFAMPAPVVAIYTLMPVGIWVGDRWGWVAMLVVTVPGAFLSLLPMGFQQRKLRAESLQRAQAEADARQRRADQAEALLKKLGA